MDSKSIASVLIWSQGGENRSDQFNRSQQKRVSYLNHKHMWSRSNNFILLLLLHIKFCHIYCNRFVLFWFRRPSAPPVERNLNQLQENKPQMRVYGNARKKQNKPEQIHISIPAIFCIINWSESKRLGSTDTVRLCFRSETQLHLQIWWRTSAYRWQLYDHICTEWTAALK